MKSNLPELPHASIYVTYEEVTGERACVADAIHLLSRLNIHGVLKTIALINNALLEIYPVREQRMFQDRLVNLLLPSHIKQKLLKSPYAENKTAAIFHRQQQLVMLRMALLSCPDRNGDPWDEKAQYAFGEACLMVNDFIGLREGEFGNPEDLYQSASNILPLATLPMDNEMASLVGRAYEIWLRIPSEKSLQAEADYVPIVNRFEDKYGISLKLFIESLFVLLAKCERFDPSDDDSLSTLIVDASKHVANSQFPQQAFETTLRIISQNLSQMRDKAFAEPLQSARNDFTILQRYPYIEIQPNVFVCFDRAFLRKMFTDGIYLLIQDALSPAENRNFQSFFGKIFETYVESLFTHILTQNPRHSGDVLKTNLKFAGSREEVCDFLLVSDNAWVVIECKGSLLTPRAKYSGNASALEDDLRAKFIGRAGQIKGVGQIANSINKLRQGLPTSAANLNWAECKLIYPCIVSYDPSVTSTFIPEIFQRKFQESLLDLPRPPTVRPLTVISIADLELFSAVKVKPRLSGVIASFHQSHLAAENFDNYLRRTYRGKINAEKSAFNSPFEKVLDSAKHYFE